MRGINKWGPTVLRVILGIIFIVHGWGKVQGMWFWLVNGSEWGFVSNVTFMPVLPAVVWAIAATAGEFFGGLLVLLGYQTRIGAALIAITMLVAIFGVHVPIGMQPDKSLFSEIEYQTALLAMAISLLLTGPGRYSIKLKK